MALSDLFIPIGLSLVVAQVAYELYLEYRQLARHRKKKLPEDLSLLISEDEFFKSQEYTVARTKFSIVKNVVDVIVLVLVVFFALYKKIWNLSAFLVSKAHLNAENEILVSVVFVFINDLFGQITEIPLKWYETFSLEVKFGFNKQTPKLFVTDKIKDFCINAVLEIPLYAVILYFIKIKLGGQFYWLIAFAVVAVFLIAVQQVYLILIMPMFNKFTPLTDEQFTSKIKGLAESCHFPLGDIFEMDGSLRSGKANAFFIGLFGNRRVVLYDTLLDYVRKDGLLNVDHILGILGHEIGHCKHNHLWKKIGILLAQMFVIFWAFSFVLESPVIYSISGFGDNQHYIIVGIMGFMVLILPVLKFVNVVLNLFTRVFEYQADRFSISQGLDLGTPLLILFTENLADFDPDPWYSFYHFSHPTLTDRLREMKYVPLPGIVEKRAAARKIKEEREEAAKKKKQEEKEALLKQLKDGKGKEVKNTGNEKENEEVKIDNTD